MFVPRTTIWLEALRWRVLLVAPTVASCPGAPERRSRGGHGSASLAHGASSASASTRSTTASDFRWSGAIVGAIAAIAADNAGGSTAVDAAAAGMTAAGAPRGTIARSTAADDPTLTEPDMSQAPAAAPG